MNKLFVLSIFASLVAVNLMTPAQAQRLKKDSLEKARWYEAPREFQITDDRPVVRDFREAPADAGSFDLPGAPSRGSGALGSAPSSLPAGGLRLGDPKHQGFRNAPSDMTTLPKSGFGATNIPARGLGPAHALPGVNQQVLGKVMSQNKGIGVGVQPARGMAPGRGTTVGSRPAAVSAPSVRSYGGYGTSSGAGSGSSGARTETSVSGKIFKRGSLLGN